MSSPRSTSNFDAQQVDAGVGDLLLDQDLHRTRHLPRSTPSRSRPPSRCSRSAPRRRRARPRETSRSAAGCDRACGRARCRRCRWRATPWRSPRRRRRSAKSIVPTTSERFAGSATNGVAKSLRLGPLVEAPRGVGGPLRRTTRGRRCRASTRSGRRAGSGWPARACCRSAPCASSPARLQREEVRLPAVAGRRRAPRSGRSRRGSARPARGRRRRRSPSAGRSSRRRPGAASSGSPPAPEVASIRTSASPASAGRSTATMTPVEVSLWAQPITSAAASPRGVGRVAGLGLDHDRVAEEGRGGGCLGELRENSP